MNRFSTNKRSTFKCHTVKLSTQRKIQKELDKMYRQIGVLIDNGEPEKAQKQINEIVKVRKVAREYNVILK